jgi:CheY-like chemotaxis protein
MSDTKKILVIDDSETSLFLVRAVFEDNPKFEIYIEKDSRQGIKQIKQKMPDLLILDIMMPWIDGYELLEKIKSEESISNLPILVISAKQDSESIDKAFQHKANGYIKKPIIVDELKTKVNAILEIGSN